MKIQSRGGFPADVAKVAQLSYAAVPKECTKGEKAFVGIGRREGVQEYRVEDHISPRGAIVTTDMDEVVSFLTDDRRRNDAVRRSDESWELSGNMVMATAAAYLIEAVDGIGDEARKERVYERLLELARPAA